MVGPSGSQTNYYASILTGFLLEGFHDGMHARSQEYVDLCHEDIKTFFFHAQLK